MDRRLERVAVALDTSDRAEFDRWCRFFGPRVGVLKVGLEAFARWGPEVLLEAREHGAAVFADLKLHDIPNTVAGAVAAVRGLGADYLTIHAGGGKAMLEAASRASGEALRLLAVTLLTHLDRESLAALDLPGEGAVRARAWARLAADAGCQGAVCSPSEVAELRSELPPPFILVTPGIRPGPPPENDDQRRTARPEDALRLGLDSSGRPRASARRAGAEAGLDGHLPEAAALRSGRASSACFEHACACGALGRKDDWREGLARSASSGARPRSGSPSHRWSRRD